MSKFHLVATDYPLAEGFSCEALCGEFVPNSAFSLIWDDQGMGEAIRVKSGCRKCIKSLFGELQPYRYIYSVYDRKELDAAKNSTEEG